MCHIQHMSYFNVTSTRLAMKDNFRIKLIQSPLSFFSFFVQLLLYVHCQRDTQSPVLRLRSLRAGYHKHTQIIPSLKVLLSNCSAGRKKDKPHFHRVQLRPKNIQKFTLIQFDKENPQQNMNYKNSLPTLDIKF